MNAPILVIGETDILRRDPLRSPCRGRRRNVSFARTQAAHILIEAFGITFAEVARNLGVTTSVIFNMLKRKNDKFN